MPIAPRDAHVDMAMTDMSVAFAQDVAAFNTSGLSPTIRSDKKSNFYHVWNNDDWHRIEADLRGPNTESKGACPSISQDQYNCKVNAVHFPISDQLAANADEALELDTAAVKWTTENLLMKRDKDWAATAYKTLEWSDDVNVDWRSVTVGSDPVRDICNQKATIMRRTGQTNLLWKLATTWDVICELTNHVNIIDRIRYTQKGVVDIDLLGSLLGVEVTVLGAMETTSPEGAATATYDFLATPAASALLMAVAPSPSRLQASAMYTFVWSGLDSVDSEFPNIARIPDLLKRSERVEGELAYDHKIVAPDLGVFFTTVLS